MLEAGKQPSPLRFELLEESTTSAPVESSPAPSPIQLLTMSGGQRTPPRKGFEFDLASAPPPASLTEAVSAAVAEALAADAGAQLAADAEAELAAVLSEAVASAASAPCVVEQERTEEPQPKTMVEDAGSSEKELGEQAPCPGWPQEVAEPQAEPQAEPESEFLSELLSPIEGSCLLPREPEVHDKELGIEDGGAEEQPEERHEGELPEQLAGAYDAMRLCGELLRGHRELAERERCEVHQLRSEAADFLARINEVRAEFKR